MNMSVRSKASVLVTGSTGYVGGRLVPRLLASGYRVRVVSRSLEKMQSRTWANDPRLEIVQADVLDYNSLLNAAKGCWAAFYLVHSMNSRQTDFSEADRRAARNMAKASSKAGIERIIYLGGLGVEDAVLSAHLRSRKEVAKILQSGTVPTTYLRAAMILGSGSASFEMLRYLVEHLPIMITPHWVRNPVQPISIRNVLAYLEGCLEHDETSGRTFDIGGPDVLSYRRLMDIYAEEAGLKKRWIIPVPIFTPQLCSHLISFLTPVPSHIARPLAEGLRNPVVCQENRIQSIVRQDLLGCRETIRLALGRIRQKSVETCWSDANTPPVPEWVHCGDVSYSGGTIKEYGYRIVLNADPAEVWQPIVNIGGQTGWYFADFLWWVRGTVDRLIGGIGFRRKRRDDRKLYAGDTVDFFRVLKVDEPFFLQLLAEVKFPGEATMEFRIKPLEDGQTELQLLSRYLPIGLSGLCYWYFFNPFHRFIFKGMLKGIARSISKPVVLGPKRFYVQKDQLCNSVGPVNTP